jgi:hypothetical protein
MLGQNACSLEEVLKEASAAFTGGLGCKKEKEDHGEECHITCSL